VVTVPNQINPVLRIQSCFFLMHFNIIIPSLPVAFLPHDQVFHVMTDVIFSCNYRIFLIIVNENVMTEFSILSYDNA
jgi:hypothetical protein